MGANITLQAGLGKPSQKQGQAAERGLGGGARPRHSRLAEQEPCQSCRAQQHRRPSRGHARARAVLRRDWVPKGRGGTVNNRASGARAAVPPKPTTLLRWFQATERWSRRPRGTWVRPADARGAAWQHSALAAGRAPKLIKISDPRNGSFCISSVSAYRTPETRTLDTSQDFSNPKYPKSGCQIFAES